MEVAQKHHTAWYRPAAARRAAWLAPAAIFLICVGFFWKLVLTDQYTWLESGDLANEALPWIQFQAAEWHKWRFPLWAPYEYAGHTLIGQGQPSAAFPPAWILYLMPLNHGWVRQASLHWYYVILHFFGALFAYWLCRDLKRSHLASITAGCAFGLGGFVGSIDWPYMIAGAIWAPLVFLFLLRSVRGERPVANAIFSGIFLGISWLSGHHQAPLFVSMAAGATWLYYVFRSGKLDWKIARLVAAFLIFALLGGALQLFPGYEYGRLSKRWVNLEDPVDWKTPVPYIVHREYSLYPISLLGIVFPNVRRQADPYIGLAITAFGLLALAVRWRDPMVRLFGMIAAGGLFFALGNNNVFHGILYSVVPFLDKARSPGLAVLIFHFGIVVLAAYGIDSFSSQDASPWPRRIALVLAALGAIIFLLMLGILLARQMQYPADDRIALTAFVALLLAALIYGWHKGNLRTTTAAIFVLFLVLVELGNDTGYYLPSKLEKSRNTYLKPMSEYADIVEFLRQQPWPVRVQVNEEEIPFNFGDWHGIDTWGYYGASLPENLLRLEPHTTRTRILFAVNYSVGKKPDMEGQEQVFVGASGLNVYLNTLAMPRAWSVHEALQVPSAEEARRRLQDPAFDLRQKTFMLKPPPQLETCAATDQVALLRRLPNRLTVQADMSCKGLVILADGYYPGWQATVDGVPTRIYEAYAGIRGVVVDKGKHRIEMKYRPRSVLLGAFFTALAFLVAGILAIRGMRTGTAGERLP